MLTKIENFFINSGRVLTDPDGFYNELDENDMGGVFSLAFYMVFLGITIGIFTNSAVFGLIFIVTSIIFTCINFAIQTIIAYLIAKLVFKAEGDIKRLFNLISYSSVLSVLLIFAIGLAGFTGGLVIVSMLALIAVWNIILTTIAVNSTFDMGMGRSFLSSNGILMLLFVVLGGLI